MFFKKRDVFRKKLLSLGRMIYSVANDMHKQTKHLDTSKPCNKLITFIENNEVSDDFDIISSIEIKPKGE